MTTQKKMQDLITYLELNNKYTYNFIIEDLKEVLKSIITTPKEKYIISFVHGFFEAKNIKLSLGHPYYLLLQKATQLAEKNWEEHNQVNYFIGLVPDIEEAKELMTETPVEWLIDQLKEQIRKSAHNELGTNRTGDYRIGLSKAIDFCEQAKEMENEQREENKPKH